MTIEPLTPAPQRIFVSKHWRTLVVVEIHMCLFDIISLATAVLVVPLMLVFIGYQFGAKP